MSTYTEYSVSQMKTMSEKYAERIKISTTAAESTIDLKEDCLSIELDATILQTLLNAPGCKGILAVFALDNSGVKDKQSITLVPCDSNGKAIKYSGNTKIKGVENWPGGARKMEDVIYPNGASNPADITQGVLDSYNDLGII